MSLAYRVIRNAIHQRHQYSSRLLVTGPPLKGRSLHSLAPVKFRALNHDFHRLAGESNCGFINAFGRNTTSFFILTRNESTVSQSASMSSTISANGTRMPESISTGLTESSNTGLTSTLSEEGTSQTHNLSASHSTSTPIEVTSSAEPESLLFESIPEPPSVPTIVEEVSLNALGEPTLESLGLGGWSPSGMVQQCLEFFHANLGMPWWASILTGTIIVRLLLFPLVVKSQKNAAKMQNNMPELQMLQAKMSEARQTGNSLLAAKYGQEMVLFMKEKDISPFKSLLVPLAMAPVFISFFFGLRKMANLPVESLKTGGLFWFTDLTVADPFYILPLITSVTVWITLEVGVDGMKLNASQHGHLMKYVFRAIPIIMFPFTLNFPAAILCYWVSTNAISLIQVSVLKLPAVRQKLNIEPARVIPADLMPKNKQGFRDSFKESWTNMKITREIEDRQRYDEISFKRAGKGPIPKTFKYDPTKVSQDAIAAVQAKRK